MTEVKKTLPSVEDSSVSSSPDRTYDAAVTALLPAAAAALAILMAALACLYAVTLTGPGRWAALAAYGGGSVLLAVAALATRHRPWPAHFAHTLATGMLLLPIAGGVLHLALSGQPWHTTTVALGVIAGGVVLLSLRWLLALLYLSFSSWLVAAFLAGPSPQWGHFGLALVAAGCCALAVGHLRRSSVRQLAEVREAAEAAAVRDHLTGLANRRGLAMVGAALVENARRSGDAVHCLFLDIDGMFEVNDRCGHAAGDEVIVAVADALREVTRGTDIVARWSGDEFCVVGPGPGMPPLELERRVHETVLPHTPVAADVWTCRITAGSAMLAPWDSGSLETLLSQADQELHLRRTVRKEARPLPRRVASTE